MNFQKNYKRRYNFRPTGPINLYTHFIGPNPRTSINPESISPNIDDSTYVGPFSSIIGDITIRKNVFIACNVTIRADEGTPFYVGNNTNIQDGVILHGLKDGRVAVDGKEYSIFIGNNVSCAHNCLIHGPCLIQNNVFVGFNAIIFNAIIGEGSYISTNSVVTGGVKIPPNSFIPEDTLVDTQIKVDMLGKVPKSKAEFSQEVFHVNEELPSAYSLMFGALRCSCGLACDPENLIR